MNILVFSSRPREPDNHLLWEGLKQYATVEIRYIDKAQQKKLGLLLDDLDCGAYDRIILDLLFKYVSTQARRLSRIPGLVFYEEDACQEYITASRWRGKFSAFYRKVPHARVFFTGYQVAKKFEAQGVDARFIAKGYDSSTLYPLDVPRDIELGFIGRLGSEAYQTRRSFLQRLEADCGLRIMRTEPGTAYREALNRIKIFVSADIGLGEYMAKNFEAMACGCLLIAYRQGAGEEQALGLEDGVNVLLFESQEEFMQRLAQLRADPVLAQQIAERGRQFACQRLGYHQQAGWLYQQLSVPMTRALKDSLFKRMVRGVFDR
ncbi:MAG: glycosyltransferase family protein [Pseudomonas sp.]